MTLSTTITAAMILCMAVILLVLVRRLKREHTVLPVTTDWLSELDTVRYRPMLRLLDARDLQFLGSQAGFTRDMARRVRRQRVQAFHGYLRLLEADFDRVGAALRVILTQEGCDRPELGWLLLALRLQVACCLIGIQFRLLLFRWGLSHVDVSGLIKLLDGMRLELRTLVPASLPLAA
jgi:hypothetical protein